MPNTHNHRQFSTVGCNINLDIMKQTILYFILTLVAKFGFSQTKNYVDQPFIETTAYVDTLVIPDKIFISIEIKESDSKNKKSVDELEVQLVAKLKEIGINTSKDLTVNDLNSNFKRYIFKGQNILKSKNYTLIVNSANLATKVFEELESIGLSNLEITKAEYSKKDELLLQLKVIAVNKAKENAVNMSKPLNQKIGSALYITDNVYNSILFNKVQSNYELTASMGSSNRIVLRGESSIIEFEKIKFDCRVVVIFKLE